jgi:LuxR family maltose regulon positive regulatory protein
MLDREIKPVVAADWMRATEGWVTGLRLAVLSLRHRGRSDDLSLRVRGDSRYLRDYLFAEVLAHIPTSYQDCLLKIAFLDRFCGPLCDAICQTDTRPTSSPLEGEAFIDWLECENLFLIPLDDQHQWFRFHHLFQELLQDMLRTQSSAEEIAALQLRASHWFAKNRLLDEALQYALAARDIEAAVQLIELNRYSLMNTEQWNQLDRWLKWLPEEVVAQRASLLSARAFVGLLRGEDLAMVNSSQQAECLLAQLPLHSPEDQIVRAEISVVQAVLDNITGQVTQSMTKAQSSLLALPSNALFIRLVAMAALVVGNQMQGDFQQGMALVRKVLSDPVWPVNMRARFMQFPSIACYQEGDLISVLEWSQQALQIAEKYELVEVISFARKYKGVAHYLRNEFTQAEHFLLALLDDRDISNPSYLAMGVIALAQIYLAQDRLMEVEQVINLVIPKFQEKRGAFALVAMEAFRVELALRRGDLTEARRLSRSVDFNVRPPTWFFYVPQLTAIKLLLAEGTEKSLAEARNQLEALDEGMRRIHRNNVRIDVLALLAMVQAAQGDLPAAIRNLEAALLLGERGGFIRNFVDLGKPMVDLLEQVKAQSKPVPQAAYIDHVLDAFPMAQMDRISATQTQSAEMLTNREFEVLSLLAQRLSNKEIAQQLVISPTTVKSHTLKIYNKLGVKNRKQAVTKAVELGILSKNRTVSLPH